MQVNNITQNKSKNVKSVKVIIQSQSKYYQLNRPSNKVMKSKITKFQKRLLNLNDSMGNKRHHQWELIQTQYIKVCVIF